MFIKKSQNLLVILIAIIHQLAPVSPTFYCNTESYYFTSFFFALILSTFSFFSLLVGGWSLYNIVVVFVIHWQESAMVLYVFPIPIPPPISLSTRSKSWAFISDLEGRFSLRNNMQIPWWGQWCGQSQGEVGGVNFQQSEIKGFCVEM